MKRLMVTLLLVTFSASAEDPKKSSTDAMIDMYVDMAKTVAEHQRLRDYTGRWNVTSKLWFDPAGEPRVARGTGTGKLILGGRFVQLDSTVKGGGVDADSVTIFGFDRRTSDYTLISFDTLGTYYVTAAGKYDDGARAVVLNGSYAQPPTGQEQKYRFELLRPSTDRHVWQLFFAMPDGKEMLVAETTLERAR